MKKRAGAAAQLAKTIRRISEKPGWAATEHEHQVALFEWARLQAGAMPELRLMYAIPNGGKRTALAGVTLKAEGVKAGVPDICLPVPRHGYGALYLELKQPNTGKVSAAQDQWLRDLQEAGNFAKVAWGWDEARELIVWYLTQQTLPGFGNTA